MRNDEAMKFVGKTLEEVLKELADDKTVLYIGSASSYFCIGNAEEVDAAIDEISEMYRQSYTKHYEANRNAMEAFPEQVRALATEDMNDLNIVANKLSYLSERIRVTSDATRKAMKSLEIFKPMRERLIKDAYTKEYETGIALILTGIETGKFWTKKEWDNAHEGRRAK